jgi:type II secretory pathway pseudopilin PulG
MELLIVMVLMLIITAASFSLLQGTMTTANTNYEMTTAAQGLRNSQEFLTRDILVAGDGFKSISNVWVPTSFVTDYLSSRPATELDPAPSRGFVSMGTVLSDNNVPAGVNVKDSNPATTVLEDSDRLTMLAVDPSFNAIEIAAGAANPMTGEISVPAARLADFTVGEVYNITGGGASGFGVVTDIDTTNNRIIWGTTGDPLGLNYTGNTGALGITTNQGRGAATLRQVNIIHYFTDAENRLVRRTFGVQEVGFVDSVIAEHVETLQFKYVLTPSTIGTIFRQPIEQVAIGDSHRVQMIEPIMRVKTAYPLQSGDYGEVEGIVRIGVRNIAFLEAPVPLDSQGNTNLPNPAPPPVIIPTPTPTPTPPPTPTSTPTITPSPTPTATPTITPSPVPTPTAAPVPTPSPVPTPTVAPPTPTPTVKKATPTPTVAPPTPTPTPTKTPKPGKGDG